MKPRPLHRFRSATLLLAAAMFGALGTGCQSPMNTPRDAVLSGDFGRARMEVRRNLTEKKSDRRYLLDRMRLGVLTLADGYPESAQTVFAQVYDVLRTQGINRDKTVQAVVLNEDLKLWKGEPFEQALAMAYYGMVQAELGSWDNARAAAENSLFYLKDFGDDAAGHRMDTYEIAQRSLAYERAKDAGATDAEAKEKADYLDHGYVAVKSNFTLGYLLHAIASQQLDREDEASDYFRRAVTIDPALQPLVRAFRANEYNTVLVVAYGLGPQKIGYGPDQSLARFVPRFDSDNAQLAVSVNELPWRRYRQAEDINTMAVDHMWNNLADVREAKSTLGSVLFTGGAFAGVAGLNARNDTVALVGLGALLAGAFLKAGAHVDTRYCDVYAQRYYLVPLNITSPRDTITLQVDNHPASRLTLTGLSAPPPPQQAQLRYVRLVSLPGGADQRPRWASTGQIFYRTPNTDAEDVPAKPLVLGGRDARAPTVPMLDDVQAAGYVKNLTPAEFQQLYRDEGLVWTLQDQKGYAGPHAIEGGKSLVAPVAGTTGFMRLFGFPYRAYQPTSRAVKKLTPAN